MATLSVGASKLAPTDKPLGKHIETKEGARRFNLETAIDCLLPVETTSFFDAYKTLTHHQLGENATHPITLF